jgi:hypothetical protein
MEKQKEYHDVRFAPEVIEEALSAYIALLEERDKPPNSKPSTARLTIDAETWVFDSVDEFIADYPKAHTFWLDYINNGKRLLIHSQIHSWVTVMVSLPTRGDIEKVFRVFERRLLASSIVVEAEPIVVFIGHGRNPQWRDLKDHLQDHHGFKVTHYEIGPRAGLTVKEVLEKMLTESSFALLVLTGEDEDSEGQMHARENVIHEAGLFQGALGFRRAIVLLEQGCKEFSNINGLNQIRFSKSNIREAFGDVVATIRREFSEEDD